jgi:hypothetical protein
MKTFLLILTMLAGPAFAQDPFASVSGTVGARVIENLAGVIEESGHEEWDGKGGMVSVCTVEIEPPAGLGQLCFAIAGPDLHNGPHDHLGAAILPTVDDMSVTYVNAPEVPGTQTALPQVSLDEVRMEGGLLHIAGRFEATLVRINTVGGILEPDGAMPVSLRFVALLPEVEDLE